MTSTDPINGTLQRFQNATEQARRFHAETIGKDVDPDRCFADFLVQIGKTAERQHNKRMEGARRLESVYKTALSEFSGGATGGYIVPIDFHNDIMRTVEETSIVRPRAMVVPMASATLLLPLPDAETAQTAGTTPFLGGMLLSWTKEGAAFTETEPAFRQKELTAWQLGGIVVASNALMADANGLEAFLTALFARSLAWYEDYAFLRGDGVGKPLGIIAGGGAKQVTRSGGSAFVLADSAAMLKWLMMGSWAYAIWAFHPLLIEKIALILGWQQNQPQGQQPGNSYVGVFQGRPAYATEKLPALGTAGDIVLFDPGCYVIGDRQQIEIAASLHPKFTNNQVIYRILSRCDGRPWFEHPITIADGANTVSPYVLLAA